MDYSARALSKVKKEKDLLIGIDSDGCAFDAMEIKHKECFIPSFINVWDLQPISKYAIQFGLCFRMDYGGESSTCLRNLARHIFL